MNQPAGQLCFVPDGGPMIPDASFVLESTTTVFQATCEVAVSDAGAIALLVRGTPACHSGPGAGLRAAADPVKCTIPPLAAGTYTVDSSPEVTFTLPGAQGVQTCPR